MERWRPRRLARLRLAAGPPNPRISLVTRHPCKPPIRQRGRSQASRRDAAVPTLTRCCRASGAKAAGGGSDGNRWSRAKRETTGSMYARWYPTAAAVAEELTPSGIGSATPAGVGKKHGRRDSGGRSLTLGPPATVRNASGVFRTTAPLKIPRIVTRGGPMNPPEGEGTLCYGCGQIGCLRCLSCNHSHGFRIGRRSDTPGVSDGTTLSFFPQQRIALPRGSGGPDSTCSIPRLSGFVRSSISPDGGCLNCQVTLLMRSGRR